jgi:hypothetical protein
MRETAAHVVGRGLECGEIYHETHERNERRRGEKNEGAPLMDADRTLMKLFEMP